ncbi:MAG: hypothetical protein KC619_24115 [Myxococcales bacterium]|nr:hypothetical protein [Myxococcales bacterium]
MHYVVWWPDLSVDFVEARNEEHLVERLDELRDPSDAKWKPYEGHPIWFALESPVRVVEPEEGRRARLHELVLEGIEDVDPEGNFFARIIGDAEMLRDILQHALPEIASTFAGEEAEQEDDPARFRAYLRTAILTELADLREEGDPDPGPEGAAERRLRAELERERRRVQVMHGALVAIVSSPARRLLALRTLAADALTADEVLNASAARSGHTVDDMARERARRALEALRSRAPRERSDEGPEPDGE